MKSLIDPYGSVEHSLGTSAVPLHYFQLSYNSTRHITILRVQLRADKSQFLFLSLCWHFVFLAKQIYRIYVNNRRPFRYNSIPERIAEISENGQIVIIS
jgi:hypothetical protein